MALQLSYEYKIPVDVIDHRAVLSHLRDVLNTFAAKPLYREFYIGITNDLERRRKEHDGKGYKLMCAIHDQPDIVVGNSFHNLEREAIQMFRDGIKHPDTKSVLLRCANSPSGSLAKNWLYILVR